jgi:hypothetical protein
MRWCCEQLGDGGEFEDREIMSEVEIKQAAHRSKHRDSRDVAGSTAQAALKAEGFVVYPKQVRAPGTGARLRLWVRGPRTTLLLQLAASNPAQFVAEYHKDGGSLGHRQGWDAEASA